jgi:hypothetical protein
MTRNQGHILRIDSKNTLADFITFDLDEAIVKNMLAEAENHRVSINTYVNQIKGFLEWDRFETKAGIIPISKPILAELFGDRTREEIIDIARRVGRNAVEDKAVFVEEKEKLLDLNSFLSWLEAELDYYSIEISHITKDNGIITHTF